ncbi:MAG: hypothetical protein ACFFFB_20765 [Candidatus Heimdallarchaeota archaeon]
MTEVNKKIGFIMCVCPVKCSYNNLIQQVGEVDAQFMTTNIVKENRECKPESSIIPIGENIKILSQKLAQKDSKTVDELIEHSEEVD